MRKSIVFVLGAIFFCMIFFSLVEGQATKEKPKQLKEVIMIAEKNIHWYGHASFRIEDAGKQIYIDPWKLPGNQPKADYIFITHSHYDHYSAEDVAKIKAPETRIIATKDVTSKEKGKTIAVKPGQSLEVGTLKVTTVPAYNLTKKFHPRDKGWVGYVITLSTGERIYHTGDTDFIPEMKSLDVDIALLPVSGTYVMDAEEAIEAAQAINPRVAIPMHYGEIVGSSKDAEKFRKNLKLEVIIKTPLR